MSSSLGKYLRVKSPTKLFSEYSIVRGTLKFILRNILSVFHNTRRVSQDAFFMYWDCHLKIITALVPTKKQPNYEDKWDRVVLHKHKTNDN